MSKFSKFETNWYKSVGEVQSNAEAIKGENGFKFGNSIQDGQLPALCRPKV